jgi:hypothetical protein
MVESPVPPPMATMRSGSIVYRIAGSMAAVDDVVVRYILVDPN